MTCKDCVHCEACGGFTPTDLDQDVFDYCIKGTTDEIPDTDERCGSFKNKADFVEVETIKSWLYEMALNNVGCYTEGDFSNACEEIISRLEGLKRYSIEKGGADNG